MGGFLSDLRSRRSQINRTFRPCRPSSAVAVVVCLLQIRSETGCRVDLPTEKSDSEYIVITGKRESAEKARDMILAMERQLVSGVKSGSEECLWWEGWE